MPATQALKKYGYDGVVEEMGEELLNRFLCQTFGINGLDDYTIDGFLNNVFYANDPEQWLVEALSFAIMGGASHGGIGAVSRIREELVKQGEKKAVKRLAELANKQIYSPAEFYLDQGLIKIEGSQSKAEQELRKKFQEKGIDENTANQFFSSATELEVREQLKKYYDDEKNDAQKRREKAVDFLTDRMLENKSFKNRDLAQKNANLFVTALEKFSETNNIPIEDLIREEAPVIRGNFENEQIQGTEIKNEANENIQTPTLDKYIQSKWDEFNSLPDDYQDEEHINYLIKDATILEKVKSGDKLTEEEIEYANSLINELDAAGYIDEVNELRAISNYQAENNNEKSSSGANVLRSVKNLDEDTTSITDNAENANPKTYYQTNEGKANSDNNPNIYFQTENFTVEELVNIGGFRNFVDRVFNKKLTQKEKSKSFEIGKTPEKLVDAGLPNNNISIGYKIIEKAHDKRSLNLSKETIKRVYEALHNPIAVIKEQNINEKTLNSRYSILLDLKNDNGNYVLAAIETDKNTGNSIVNDIRSIHSRKNFEPIIDKALNDRRLLKVDMDKIKDLLLTNQANSTSAKNRQPDIISGKAASLLDRIYQKQNNVKYYQSAYHGTGQRFDEFSTDNIGTGEGAQAHGWGLYFANNRNVAERYRENLIGKGQRFEIKSKGVPLESKVTSELLEILQESTLFKIADGEIKFKDALNEYLESENKAIERDDNLALNPLRAAIKFIEENPKVSISKLMAAAGDNKYRFKDIVEAAKKQAQNENRKTTIQDVKKAVSRRLAPLEAKIQKRRDRAELLSDLKNLENVEVVINNYGQLFEVDIPGNDVLLDEDKTYNEQSDEIKEILKQVLLDEKLSDNLEQEITDWEYGYTGRNIYDRLSNLLGSDKQASLLLNEYGIKGITYKGLADGRCYVILMIKQLIF